MKRIALAALLSLVLASLAGQAHAGPGADIRFRTEVIKDPMSNGIEAFRMLVPTGWSRRGGVVWNLRYSNVASVSMTVTDAAHHQGLQVFPAIPQVWDPGRYLGPPGTNYLGMEVRQPVSAAGLIEQLIVPAFRGSLHPTVLRETRLPKVAAALTAKGSGAGVSNRYDAARVRIAYTANGRAMEEDFTTVVSYTTSPTLPGTTMWQPQILYSFSAPRGKLDGAARVLQTMVSSVRPSLKWYAGYQYVFNLWVQGQMQAINAAGQLSKQLAAASDSICELDEPGVGVATGELRPRLRRALGSDPRRRDLREPVRGPRGAAAERLPLRLGLLGRRVRAVGQRGLRPERRLHRRLAVAADRPVAAPTE